MTNFSSQNLINDKSFDEQQWMKILFLISDTQEWLDQVQRQIICQVPFQNKRKIFQKTFYLPVTSLAHILEGHYYKIHRFPGNSKFTISISEIVSFIRDASEQLPDLISGTNNFQRKLKTDKTIGLNLQGEPTDIITIITDAAGRILTAFPGTFCS